MLNKQYYIYDCIDKICVQNKIGGNVIVDITTANQLLLKYQIASNDWDRYTIKVKQAAK